MLDTGCDSGLATRGHEGVELSDDIRHGIAEVLKRLNYGRGLECLDIAKEYINGRIGILVKLHTHSRRKLHQDSTALWPYAKGGILHREGHRPVWVQDFHVSDLGDADNGGQSNVLISIVERIEAKDFLSCPTWVCREGDKELLRIGSGCFYSVTRGFVIDPVSPANGEMEVSVLCTSVAPNQFPRGMVERSPEVMGRIANDQGKGGGYFLAEAHLDSHCASVRIAAEAKRMGVSLFKRAESNLQIIDVLIGPLDFVSRAAEHPAATT